MFKDYIIGSTRMYKKSAGSLSHLFVIVRKFLIKHNLKLHLPPSLHNFYRFSVEGYERQN